MEEAHESSGDGYYRVMNACKNAHYRLALTATPFMSESPENNFRLMGASGEVAIQVTEKELIEAGTLAKPYFRFLDCPRPAVSLQAANYQKAYKHLIVENMDRNHLVVQESLWAVKHGLSVLVLVKNTQHGEILQKMFNKLNPKGECVFISGSTDTGGRKRALESLERQGVVISTKILDVGVDVPSVGFLVLAGGDKAEVAMRQRIGRVLRRKKRGPNVCFVVDFNDSHNRHLMMHAKQRRRVVESTEGFKEGILPKGSEFNWEWFSESE